MNINKIISQMKRKYPRKKIICETEPTEDHPDWSEAIAVIDFTRLHYHKKLTEIYEVIKGDMVNMTHQNKLKIGSILVLGDYDN